MKKLQYIFILLPFFLFAQQDSFVVSQWGLAESFHRNGDREKCIGIYQNTLDSLLSVESEESNVFQISSTYNKLGLRLQNYGRWDESALVYTDGILLLNGFSEHDSLLADLTLNLGLLYVKLSEPSQEYYLNLAEKLALKSSNNRVLYILYKVTGQYQKGIKFSKAILNDQYLSNFYYLEGRLVSNMKLYFDSAKMVLPKPIDAPLQNFQYHIFIVDYFLQQNLLDSALFHCQEAELLAPYLNDEEVDAHYLSTYSKVYLKMQDYKKAYEYKSISDSISANFNSSKNRNLLFELDKQKSIYKVQNEVIRLKFIQQVEILLILALLIIVFTVMLFLFRIKKLNRKLLESNSSKETLFSIISHDLRTPLISLKRIIDSQGDLNDNKKILRSGVFAILFEFDNLLTWSANQLNRITPDPINADLSQIIEDNITLNSVLIDSKNILITNKYTNDCGAFVDERMINTCFNNVLSNAIKYCPVDSEIVIEVVEGVNTIVKVNNTICKTISTKGLGLGLSICKDFIEANNGAFKIIKNANTYQIEITIPNIKE